MAPSERCQHLESLARVGGSQGAPAQGPDAPTGAGPAGTRWQWEPGGRPSCGAGDPCRVAQPQCPGRKARLHKMCFQGGRSPPKHLRNALTCCPACVGGCLRRQAGPITAAGRRDALPGAWGGDRVSLRDSKAVAYRLLAGRLGTDRVNPLEAKTGGFVGSLVLCTLTRVRPLAQACAQPVPGLTLR